MSRVSAVSGADADPEEFAGALRRLADDVEHGAPVDTAAASLRVEGGEATRLAVTLEVVLVPGMETRPAELVAALSGDGRESLRGGDYADPSEDMAGQPRDGTGGIGFDSNTGDAPNITTDSSDGEGGE